MAEEKHIAVRDDDGHWYWIPESLSDKFDEFLELEWDEEGWTELYELFNPMCTGSYPG